MDWLDSTNLYPDIGDLTPQELAERNTYGYVPSRGETAPPGVAPTAARPPRPCPPAPNYSPQLDEIITALAALSRQTQRLCAEVRGLSRHLRGATSATSATNATSAAGATDATDAPAAARPREEDDDRPYVAPPPAQMPGPDGSAAGEDAFMSTLDAAVCLGCSVGHVRRIPGLVPVRRGQRVFFTRASVLAARARRGGKGARASGGRGGHVV